MASKFVAIARDRAEAKFVICYKQLVTTRSMVEFKEAVSKLELPRTNVLVGAELGRGQSGVVFAGTLLASKTTPKVEVAIKTRLDSVVVGESATVADEALLLEALLLNGLQHPGIVQLLAVVTTTAPIMIVTELMPNGDLRNFLRKCRRQKPGSHPSPITTMVMFAMTAKLASAMAFLERASIIHRDVAARNVLVGAEPTSVKMADLGAARNVHRMSESSYSGVYVAQTDHNPARWMPLEALREAKFSHKSDVFAFGVLLWEILSLGQTPWGAFGVRDFTEALGRGDRLQLPANQCAVSTLQCSGSGISGGVGHKLLPSNTFEIIYKIALRCWSEKPRKRPHFHQLETEFAIQLTVSKAENAPYGAGESAIGAASGGYLDVQTTGAGSADSSGAERGYATEKITSADVGADGTTRALDLDGYVADSIVDDFAGASGIPALDSNGYVADSIIDDGADANIIPALDSNGYVDDTVVDAASASTLAIPVVATVVGAVSLANNYADDSCAISTAAPPRSAWNGFVEGDATLREPMSAGGMVLPQNGKREVPAIGHDALALLNDLELHIGESDSTKRSLHPDETRL
jgi:serine/threonine protein kinase